MLWNCVASDLFGFQLKKYFVHNIARGNHLSSSKSWVISIRGIYENSYLFNFIWKCKTRKLLFDIFLSGNKLFLIPAFSN